MGAHRQHSSMGGEFPTPFSGVYHAGKFSVEAILDAMRFEVQPFGIDVIVIQPGLVQTPLENAAPKGLQSSPDSPSEAQVQSFRHFLEANAGPQEASVLSHETITQVIMQAVASPNPETRYKIGAEAGQIPALRRKLSDREWDMMYHHLVDPAD
jgi:short-subunit dehydrogenase